MMSVDNQRVNSYLFYGLSASLILYALTCPISRSANYFPLASLSLFALVIWLKGKERFRVSGPLIWLGGLWLSLMAWRSVTIYVNGGGFTLSPMLKTFNVLPIFFLYGLPCDAEWKKRQSSNALFVLLSVTSATIILGLFQKMFGIDYPLPEQPFQAGKLMGFVGYHIHAGGFFSTLAVLAICLILFWQTSQGTKIFLSVLLSILGLGLLFSMSRTYYVSLIVTLPFIFVRKSLKATFIGTVAVLLLVITALTLSPSIRERTLSIADVKKNPSNVERLYLWKVARDMIADNPVAGVGFKQWGENLYRYKDKYAAEWQFTPAALHHAHNVYLSVAAETGIVGLALFLVFWLYLLYLMFMTARKASPGSFAKAVTLGASFALINLLIGGMFEENFGSTLVNIFLISYLIALSFFVVTVEKRDIS